MKIIYLPLEAILSIYYIYYPLLDVQNTESYIRIQQPLSIPEPSTHVTLALAFACSYALHLRPTCVEMGDVNEAVLAVGSVSQLIFLTYS